MVGRLRVQYGRKRARFSERGKFTKVIYAVSLSGFYLVHSNIHALLNLLVFLSSSPPITSPLAIHRITSMASRSSYSDCPTSVKYFSICAVMFARVNFVLVSVNFIAITVAFLPVHLSLFECLPCVR